MAGLWLLGLPVGLALLGALMALWRRRQDDRLRTVGGPVDDWRDYIAARREARGMSD